MVINHYFKFMEVITFGKAFKYPFNRPLGLLNILWMFLPILGWFALGGYGFRIVNEFLAGKFEQLPTFDFMGDMKFGFFMFLKAIPFMITLLVVMGISYYISEILGGILEFFISVFVLPVLGINFIKKQTVESFFEFRIVEAVVNNLGDYIIAFLKTIALTICYLPLMIVLVGFPAQTFSKNIFLADFYRRKVK